MDKQYYLYILASKRNGTLYTGVINNLIKRIYKHKNDIIKGFTQIFTKMTRESCIPADDLVEDKLKQASRREMDYRRNLSPIKSKTGMSRKIK